MKDNGLKPCPFCGGEAKLEKGNNPMFGRTIYIIKCSNDNCQIYYLQTKSTFSKKEAIEAWNRRVENER